MKCLIDKLLETSVESFEPQTEEFTSKALQKSLGEKDEVKIKIKGLKYSDYNYYLKAQIDKEGNFDFEKGPRAKSRMAAQCIVDPDLSNERLLKHFECVTPADLAEKLFSLEINAICDEITKLSGLIESEEEIGKAVDETKN